MKRDSGAIAVPGDLDSIAEVRRWLEELLLRWSVPHETVADIQSAVTEICTNVIRHGFNPDDAGEVKLEAIHDTDTIEITITDNAPAFVPDPETHLPRQRLAEGGYGLFMVDTLMDQVTYEPLGEVGNRTTLVKRISTP